MFLYREVENLISYVHDKVLKIVYFTNEKSI